MHYMTRDERYQLEALLKAKVRVSRIARQLGFCRQTIYNEMKRGAYVHTCDYWDEKRYSADKAQQLHKYNQTASSAFPIATPMAAKRSISVSFPPSPNAIISSSPIPKYFRI